MYPPKSGAPIPQNAISLSDAFAQFYAVVRALKDDHNAAEDDGEALSGDLGKAEVEFRDLIATGAIAPMIRDPRTDTILQAIPASAWVWSSTFPPSGIGEGEDYVWPDDPLQMGPSTTIGDVVQPVFFLRNDFDKFISGERRARSRGTSALKRVRDWLCSEMKLHENPPRLKQDYCDRAVADGITPNRFRELWRDLLDETGRRNTWGKQGRKKAVQQRNK